MNEFYEAVSNLLEEMRCDCEEREYTVETEEWKTAGKSLKQIQKRLPFHLEKMSEREQDFWKKYLDQLEHFHIEMSGSRQRFFSERLPFYYFPPSIRS